MKLSYTYAFLILLSIPLLTNSKELKSFVQILKKYTTSDIVSLISECKTKNYKIIDPDDYLKKEDEEALEKQLKEIYAGHNVVTIIVVVRNLDLTDNNQKKIDISNYTEIVLDEIYSKKIVKKESSIVLALVSIEGKIMTMKAYGQVGYTITQQDCYNILNIINNYYSYGEYSYGTVELSKLIKYYLVNTSFFSRNKRFFIMLIILFSSFVFCYILAIVAQKIREKRNLRLTMTDEQKLIKIRDFLKRCKADKEILSDNCIICLEPFDNCKSLNHSSIKEPNNENNENNKDINNNREGLILEENEDKKQVHKKKSYIVEFNNTKEVLLKIKFNNQKEIPKKVIEQEEIKKEEIKQEEILPQENNENSSKKSNGKEKSDSDSEDEEKSEKEEKREEEPEDKEDNNSEPKLVKNPNKVEESEEKDSEKEQEKDQKKTKSYNSGTWPELFVNNLSYKTTDESLKKYFSKYGEVESTKIVLYVHLM